MNNPHLLIFIGEALFHKNDLERSNKVITRGIQLIQKMQFEGNQELKDCLSKLYTTSTKIHLKRKEPSLAY